MAARKGWESLSATQRRRYERAGLDRSAYESGASLAVARGHGSTPERPAAAERNPRRYKSYLRRRSTAGMRMVTTSGVVVVEGLSAGERSWVGSHDNAVRSLLQPSEIPTGYTSILSDFRGRSVTGYRPGSDVIETFRFETDPDRLITREGRGELRFESVYEKRAA